MRSGAVMLHEWELDDLYSGHPALALFGITLNPQSKKKPQTSWSMYSDTGIMLRGPAYYVSLAHGQQALPSYLEVCNVFHRELLGV
jgi:hypothetical protein